MFAYIATYCYYLYIARASLEQYRRVVYGQVTFVILVVNAKCIGEYVLGRYATGVADGVRVLLCVGEILATALYCHRYDGDVAL